MSVAEAKLGPAGLVEVLENGVFAALDALSREEVIHLTERYGAHNYHPLPLVIARGEGAKVWDKDGREYYDFVGCYSAVAHGHLAEPILEAVREQLHRITLTSRAVYTAEMALFLKVLCEYTGMEMALPMNTGAEATETAIKLARKWGYVKKGIPLNKAEIVVAEGNFHGRTTTIVGFSSEKQYYEFFGPYAQGAFPMVPFGDLAALDAAITPNTCAVLLEPIQAEGGIIIPPEGYLAGVRRLCDKHNVLLIWDEVQTGFCRTGKRFAWQWEDAKPDLMALGKALGGGVMPVAAVVGTQQVMEVFKPGDHGSTFGGNPLAAIVGVASIVEMFKGKYEERSLELGRFFLDGLRAVGSPHIKEVRGRGLLIGLEFGKEAGKGMDFVPKFLENGVITKDTHEQTLRFAPPLTVTKAQLEDALGRIAKALA